MIIDDRTRQRIQRFLYLRRAVELVWQSTPTWTIASIIFLVLQGILPLVSLYLTKLIIDSITAALGNSAQGDSWKKIVVLIILGALVALLNDLCRSLTNFVSEAQSQIVNHYVQNLLHAKSIEVDLEYYENPQYYDSLHRAQAQAIHRPTLILNQLIKTGQSTISLGAIAFLLLSLHWAIATILFIAMLPILFVRLKYADEIYNKARTWTSQERKAYYFNRLLTHESHAKEIRLFNLGSLFQKRFRHLRNTIRQEKLTLARRRTLSEAFTQGSATIAVFLAFAFIAYQTLQGIITLGSLVMYYQAFQRGQNLLKETFASLAILYENSLFLANLYEFLDLKPTVIEPSHPKPIPQTWQVGIQFNQVQFKYAHSTRSVLEDLNFTIDAGETIALVGENGAGKTTLIKLLCRLYDPTYGQITLEGIDLRNFSQKDLRQQISIVFQDYARYNLTVQENIGFGSLELLSEEEKISLAAHAAGADKVIARLPYRYNTTLGHQFQEGEELSIGEWQKIALARAFLRPAQLIIVDEPTSALDPQAEAEILSHFRQLTKHRTAILISHRLSTVRLADRIFVLEGGTITESGTHQQLIQLQGTYARLFETQAQSYR